MSYYQQSFMSCDCSTIISLSNNQYGCNIWGKDYIIELTQPLPESEMYSTTYFITNSLTTARKWFDATKKALKLTVPRTVLAH